MDVKELRIGNWVRIKSRIHKGDYTTSTIDWISAYEGRNIGLLGNGVRNESYLLEGIPLTQELLQKAALTLIEEGHMSPDIYEKKYTKRLVENSFTFHFDGKDGYWIERNTIVKVNFLHQLQNLYFTLTGEELEINL